ncbi:MAG: hypothetical protein WCE21_02665 [Candidatus Babeliales bacterium]
MNTFSLKLFAACILTVCISPVTSLYATYETRMEAAGCSCNDCACKECKDGKECPLKHDARKKSLIRQAIRILPLGLSAVAYIAYLEPLIADYLKDSKFQSAAKKIAEVIFLKELLNAISEEAGKPLFNKIRPVLELPDAILFA